MKLHFLLAAILSLFFSCKRKDTVSAGIIPAHKMKTVVWDMMRADQFLEDYVLNKDSSLDKNTERRKYYQQVFAIHQIKEKNFQKSLNYYRAHPSLFKKIMDSISQISGEAPTQIVIPEVSIDSVSVKQFKPLRTDSAYRLKRIKQVN